MPPGAMLDRIAEAAFANPFGARRDELDRQIAGSELTGSALREAVEAKVREACDSLPKRRLGDSDTALRVVLFDAFHRFAPRLVDHLELERTSDEARELACAAELLEFMVSRGVEPRRAERMVELFWQMQRAYTFISEGLTGTSAPMHRLRESLWSNLFTQDVARYERHLWNRMEDFGAILLGPTGSGKGAAAAALGRSGFIAFDPRTRRFASTAGRSFVPINLSQFPESLIESELFGHVKGAFTGAIAKHEGALASCPEFGTTFLDEIGETTTVVQIKLLRVLQEREFSPVGSHETIRFGGRVIAATHQDLDMLRSTGRFRDDFYYRLCSDVIQVPSLADRIKSQTSELHQLLGVLIERTLGHANQELTEEVHAVLLRDLGKGYRWPGNVRELEQQMRRVLMTGKAVPDTRVLEEVEPVDDLRAESVVSAHCARLYERHGNYQHVARLTGLDRRTVKRHVEAWSSRNA